MNKYKEELREAIKSKRSRESDDMIIVQREIPRVISDILQNDMIAQDITNKILNAWEGEDYYACYGQYISFNTANDQITIKEVSVEQSLEGVSDGYYKFGSIQVNLEDGVAYISIQCFHKYIFEYLPKVKEYLLRNITDMLKTKILSGEKKLSINPSWINYSSVEIVCNELGLKCHKNNKSFLKLIHISLDDVD